MSASTLLTELFEYKAWANEELFVALSGLHERAHATERRTAILILNHVQIVDRIFAAHLRRKPHRYTASGTADAPPFASLAEAVRWTDRWYLEYVPRLSADELAEPIEFAFTDGAQGRMSREEMLAHVITHGGYHRGEVGYILRQLDIVRPRDIFTGYLHKTETALPEWRQAAAAGGPGRLAAQ
jgi:uncharacterized damage-inducible protein DinB